MTPPPTQRVSEREALMYRLMSPTARIVSATVILITGMGLSAIFWKMPQSNERHALYCEGSIDQGVAATPLPSESIATLSPEVRERMTLPELDFTPIAAEGIPKYTQVYPLPVSLAARNSDSRVVTVSADEESVTVPIVPQRFEPMRQIIDEKPISIEPVNREFQLKPSSVSTVEKSDEMLSMFHFAENSRADSDLLSEQELPVDPFTDTFAIAVNAPSLQPLQPLQPDALSPLLPLKSTDLQPLPVLITQ